MIKWYPSAQLKIRIGRDFLPGYLTMCIENPIIPLLGIHPKDIIRIIHKDMKENVNYMVIYNSFKNPISFRISVDIMAWLFNEMLCSLKHKNENQIKQKHVLLEIIE